MKEKKGKKEEMNPSLDVTLDYRKSHKDGEIKQGP